MTPHPDHRAGHPPARLNISAPPPDTPHPAHRPRRRRHPPGSGYQPAGV